MPASDIGEFIVAAPDSPTLRTPYQAGVYVSGSTDAQDAIQNALDDLPPAGGTVRILAGNYELKKQSGQTYCVTINGDNKRLVLDEGAILKLADNQFESTAGEVIKIGRGNPSGTVVQETQLTLWGPGIVDGNEANLNEKAIGVKAHGKVQWLNIGGGLHIKNCESNPLSVSGRSGSDRMENVVLSRLFVEDCTEGIFLVGSLRYITIDHLHVENISAQDGLEPINVDFLTMTNSVIRDTLGSAVDIFSSTASSTDTGHIYSNCIFGPLKDGGNVVAVGVGGEAAHANHLFVNCLILMENAARGFHVGASGAGSSTVKGLTIQGCMIDGTSGKAGSDGITIGADATEVSLLGNHISNCPGNAIDRTANPAKLHIKNNSGWGNTSPISAGTGADNVLSGNDFIA